MALVKNHSPGGRVVLHDTGEKNERGPILEQVLLRPGESRQLNLNMKDPVHKGLMECGDLSVDGRRGSGGDKEDEGLARAHAELEEKRAELEKREAELRAKESELRLAADPKARAEREAADAAGRTPGLAAPHPSVVKAVSEADRKAEAEKRAEPARPEAHPAKK